MSTEGKGTSVPESSAPADEIKNLKSEFNRKIDNVTNELKKSNEMLLSQLQQMQAPKVAPAQSIPHEEDLEDLIYKNPKLYTQKVEERAVNRVKDELNKRDVDNAKLSNAVNSLYSEFPELNQTDGELYKLAISKQSEMAKEYGNNVATMKAAVAEAALELGVKPKSKREKDDDFTISGRGADGESAPRKRGKGGDEVHPHTKIWAEALGADMDRVKARMSKRKNYTKYE